jgi:hypothetical protein
MDGWHPFRGAVLRSHLTNVEDSRLCDELDYLAMHKYIAASHRLHVLGRRLYVRIYVIPFDLPNVDGRLLVRVESISRNARSYLRRLLPRIDKNLENWEGHWDIHPGREPPFEQFLCSEVVHSSYFLQVTAMLELTVFHIG